MASRRKCPNLKCGKPERSQTEDSFFCKKCGVLMDPTDPNNPPYPSSEITKEAEKNIQEEKGDDTMKKYDNGWSIATTILASIAVILLLISLLLRGCGRCDNDRYDTNETTAIEATTTETTLETTIDCSYTEETTIDSSYIEETTEPGLDIPMETWRFIPAGSVISGDVAIYDGDNNNLKKPINDGLASTADIIYVSEGMNFWFEYGGFVIENATQEQIIDLIDTKLQEFPIVRYFPSFTKLGKNTFVTYPDANNN